eukprot:600075-Amphidinium_carterae.1
MSFFHVLGMEEEDLGTSISDQCSLVKLDGSNWILLVLLVSQLIVKSVLCLGCAHGRHCGANDVQDGSTSEWVNRFIPGERCFTRL